MNSSYSAQEILSFSLQISIAFPDISTETTLKLDAKAYIENPPV